MQSPLQRPRQRGRCVGIRVRERLPPAAQVGSDGRNQFRRLFHEHRQQLRIELVTQPLLAPLRHARPHVFDGGGLCRIGRGRSRNIGHGHGFSDRFADRFDNNVRDRSGRALGLLCVLGAHQRALFLGKQRVGIGFEYHRQRQVLYTRQRRRLQPRHQGMGGLRLAQRDSAFHHAAQHVDGFTGQFLLAFADRVLGKLLQGVLEGTPKHAQAGQLHRAGNAGQGVHRAQHLVGDDAVNLEGLVLAAQRVHERMRFAAEQGEDRGGNAGRAQLHGVFFGLRRRHLRCPQLGDRLHRWRFKLRPRRSFGRGCRNV